jgi:oligopeptidase B
MAVSPDGTKAAIMVDDNGSERFKLRIRDLATGQDIETVTEVGIGEPVWTADSRAIVYTEVNENWRSYRARLHRLGQPPASDKTIYEEKENLAFTVDVGKTQDEKYILISTGENSSNEIRFVPADNPEAPLTLIASGDPTSSTASIPPTGNCGCSPMTSTSISASPRPRRSARASGRR